MKSMKNWPKKAPADLTPDEYEQVRKSLGEVNEEARYLIREAEKRIAEYKRMGNLR